MDSKNGFGNSIKKRFLNIFKRNRRSENTVMEEVTFELVVDKRVQWCGRPVSGLVRVSSARAVLIEALTIKLEGVGEYTYYKQNTPISSDETLIQLRQDILREGIIQVGVSNYIFEFELPDGLPPSYRKVSNTTIDADIHYDLKLYATNYIEEGVMMNKIIEKRLFVRESRQLTVLRTTEQIHYELVIHPQNYETVVDHDNNIVVIASMDKFRYAPGERIPIQLYVKNDTNSDINCVYVELFRQISITRPGEVQPVVVKIYAEDRFCSGTIAKRSVSCIPFELRTNPRHVTIRQCKLFAVWFRLLVGVSAPTTPNESMSIPLEISNKRVKIIPVEESNHNEDANNNEDKARSPPPQYALAGAEAGEGEGEGEGGCAQCAAARALYH